MLCKQPSSVKSSISAMPDVAMRAAPVGATLAVIFGLLVAGQSRAQEPVMPPTAPMPKEVADIITKLGFGNIDKIVVVPESGPPMIWYTHPLDLEHPIDIDTDVLIQGVLDEKDYTNSPAYYYQKRLCVKRGKQCVF